MRDAAERLARVLVQQQQQHQQQQQQNGEQQQRNLFCVGILASDSPLFMMAPCACSFAALPFCFLGPFPRSSSLISRAFLHSPPDPELPAARLQRMIFAASVFAIITPPSSAEIARACAASAGIAVLSLQTTFPFEIGAPHAYNAPCSLPLPSSSSYSHVAFTSGTTGDPKCILFSNLALMTYAAAAASARRLSSSSVILQVSPPTFDPCIGDIASALFAQCQISLPPRHSVRTDPAMCVRACSATHITCTPALLNMMIDPSNVPTLECVAVGGEALPHNLMMQWSSSGCRLLVTYGVTEVTVYQTIFDATACNFERRSSGYAIGNALQGVGVAVVDSDGKPNPRGQSGQIVLFGPQLAFGYIGPKGSRHESSIESGGFRQLCLDSDGLSLSAYFTGDEGIMLDDDQLLFLGRSDSQVKVRGHRVELGEVEAGVSQSSLVEICCAACEGETLVAYVTLSDKGKKSMSIALSSESPQLPLVSSSTSVLSSESSLPPLLPSVPFRLSGLLSHVIRWRLRLTLPAYAQPHVFVYMYFSIHNPFDFLNIIIIRFYCLILLLTCRRSLLDLPEKLIAVTCRHSPLYAPRHRFQALSPTAALTEERNGLQTSALASSTYSSEQNFFAAGGDSLSAFRVVKGIREGLGLGMDKQTSLTTLFLENPSPRLLLPNLPAPSDGAPCLEDSRWHQVPIHDQNDNQEDENEFDVEAAAFAAAGSGDIKDEGRAFLHFASMKGDVNVLSELLSAGADPHPPPQSRVLPAAIEGATDLGKKAIKKRSKRALVPLHAAAASGSTECVKALISAGVKLTVVNGAGSNAAHIASATSPGVLQLLLDAGIPPGALDANGQGYLHHAARAGCVQCAKLLIWGDVFDPIDYQASRNRAGPLSSAVDTRDRWFRTPLQWAIINGHVDMTTFLIKSGASVNWTITGRTINKKNTHARLDTPLHLAARRGGKEGLQIALLLLDQGADATAKDSDGNTTLIACVQGNGFDDGECEENLQFRQQCMQTLVSFGCPLVPDAFGASVAENAVRYGRSSLLPSLESLGCDCISAQDLLHRGGNQPDQSILQHGGWQGRVAPWQDRKKRREQAQAMTDGISRSDA